MKISRDIVHELRVSELRHHFDDVITLCEYVSRKYGIEMTLEQGREVYQRIQPVENHGQAPDVVPVCSQRNL